jgi:hypothetical protein
MILEMFVDEWLEVADFGLHDAQFLGCKVLHSYLSWYSAKL